MVKHSTVALVVAAGRGVRAGGGIPKQYREILGAPLLRHTVRVFTDHPRVDAVCVVIHPDDRDLYDDAVSGLSVLDPVPGGAARQDSVRLGLEALAAHAPDIVLIQDGARPFSDEALISRVIDALGSHAGAIPALALSDTIKQATSGVITATLPRETLYRAQTPQGFRFPGILAAHRRCQGLALTDDAAVAEHEGLDVAIVAGSEGNMKITEPDDFHKAQARLGGGDFVFGQGFDVHGFEAGDHVWLCGVKIPHTHKLEGHSDADAGLHALTDAILGAIGAGDIGMHFPPTDPKWKGASSDQFLIHAVHLAHEAGARLVHVDVTLICERPKIGPHREAMVARLSTLLGLPPARVSVKATTTEGLGFTGRREGLAAQAVATLQLKPA